MHRARDELEAQRRAFLEPLSPPSFHSDVVPAADAADGAVPAVTVQTFVSPEARPGRHVVFLHGGGWCVGSSTTHWPIILYLGSALQAQVHSVEYPLAPEFPYPIAPRAVQRATAHILARDRPDRWWLAGDSAGANLVLAESLRRGQREAQPDGLWLAYGCYREPPSPPAPGSSWVRFGDGAYGLTGEAMLRYRRLYAPDYPGPGPASLDPLYGVHGAIPPTYVLAASHDPLLDDSLALAQRLGELGSVHRLRVMQGYCHGCLAYPHWLSEVRAAWDDASLWLLAAGSPA